LVIIISLNELNAYLRYIVCLSVTKPPPPPTIIIRGLPTQRKVKRERREDERPKKKELEEMGSEDPQ